MRQGAPVLVVELDWRVREGVEKGLGFFVHVHPDGGDRVSADHPQVSDSISLDDAPAGKTLRDVLVIGAPAKPRGRKWAVGAGLWRLHGDGSRVRVTDKGAASP